LLDFATSVMAIGKLEVALARRSPIKPGALLDAEGQPTTDPADFFAGGALLPFGAYKGYAMSTLVEVLGGALSGAAPSCLPEYDAGNGTMVVALNIAAFQPVAHFIDQTTRFAATIRESLPAEGFDTVLLPGDPETLARRQRDASGIPLPVQTWHALQDLASELGVQV
jgi:LDH2 family malate/lactate/ureidoglycolate dehydrogenase